MSISICLFVPRYICNLRWTALNHTCQTLFERCSLVASVNFHGWHPHPMDYPKVLELEPNHTLMLPFMWSFGFPTQLEQVVRWTTISHFGFGMPRPMSAGACLQKDWILQLFPVRIQDAYYAISRKIKRTNIKIDSKLAFFQWNVVTLMHNIILDLEYFDIITSGQTRVMNQLTVDALWSQICPMPLLQNKSLPAYWANTDAM